MHSLSTLFRISPSSGVPIYRQIIDQVRTLIASGRWPEGTMLPSVRQMAVELEINMMTVSGKSTFIKCLLGLLEVDAGQVQLFGEASVDLVLCKRTNSQNTTAMERNSNSMVAAKGV